MVINKSCHIFLMLLIVIGGILSFACSEDDGNINHKSKSEYSFMINGQPFYYSVNEPIGLNLKTYFDIDDEWCYCSINAYDKQVSYESYDQLYDSSLIPYNFEVEAIFTFNSFNPKKMNTGDALTPQQSISSIVNYSDDPKYLFDFNNYLSIYDKDDLRKEYTWKGKPNGKITFISYKEDPEFDDYLLTLGFENVTLEMVPIEDYENHPFKANTVTINGKITFSSNVYDGII